MSEGAWKKSGQRGKRWEKRGKGKALEQKGKRENKSAKCGKTREEGRRLKCNVRAKNLSAL